jgi:hypothetical protein
METWTGERPETPAGARQPQTTRVKGGRLCLAGLATCSGDRSGRQNLRRAWMAEEDDGLKMMGAVGPACVCNGAAHKPSAKAVDSRLNNLRQRDRDVTADAGIAP